MKNNMEEVKHYWNNHTNTKLQIEKCHKGKVWETVYSDQWFQYFKPKELYGVKGYTNDR